MDYFWMIAVGLIVAIVLAIFGRQIIANFREGMNPSRAVSSPRAPLASSHGEFKMRAESVERGAAVSGLIPEQVLVTSTVIGKGSPELAQQLMNQLRSMPPVRIVSISLSPIPNPVSTGQLGWTCMAVVERVTPVSAVVPSAAGASAAIS